MGKTIVSETINTLSDVDNLINAGKPRSAEGMLRGMQDEKEFRKNPEFWFRILLVSNLLSRPIKDVKDLHDRVKTYDGWNESLEIDYQRDLVLRMIRHLGILHTSPTQVALIERMIDDGVRNTYGDPNREAAWTATRARLYIALGKFEEAAASCEHADQQWAAIKERANQQWRRNNTYHWFIATRLQLSNKQLLWSRMTAENRESIIAHKAECLLSEVVDNPEERNKSRKAVTYATFYTGRLGHLAYQVIAKYHR